MDLTSIVPQLDGSPGASIPERQDGPGHPTKGKWQSLNTIFSILAGVWGALCLASVALGFFAQWNHVHENAVLFLVLLISGGQALVILGGAGLASKAQPRGYKLIIFGILGFSVFMRQSFTAIDYVANVFFILSSIALRKALLSEAHRIKGEPS